MTTTGQASYFDGVTSARHDVTVTLGVSALQIHSTDGRLLAEWPYSMLDKNHAGPRFVCGTDAAEGAGRAAFDKMFAKLERAAGQPIPLRIAVVRSEESNAVTLPGGIIYVFHGLIDKAQSAEEVAGV